MTPPGLRTKPCETQLASVYVPVIIPAELMLSGTVPLKAQAAFPASNS